ncbi:MAG: PAS domain S-box protein [Candidatus Sulfotelmatobacter sp.]|jgi:PAS domain S-box-containing protein
MQSPLPENEVGRVEALRNYRILDTPTEERFDDLARLAAYVCGTPIGLIGLIDSSREWFKSRVGWDVNEIPREVSIGTYAILQHDVLIVSDTLKDIRFAKNQLATQAGVRFYAGAPLLTPEGYALGTLCVMDPVPRALTEGQGRILWALARQVMAHLEAQRDLGSNPGRESYERYRRFFESSVVGFYRTTLDGQVLDCNPAFVRIMGYASREELLACHALEFYFSPGERQDFLEQCLSLGSLTNFASRLRRKDGSSVWVLENVEPVLGQEGTPAMIEGTLVDISQQKFAEAAHNQAQRALEDSETRYRRLFETAKDGILILDFKTGQIVDVNPFLIEMLGYTHGEFVGKKLWEIGPFKDISASRSAFSELQTKGVIRYEDLPLETKDGRRINVEFVSNVYPVDGTQVVQCNIRDITERVRAEAELKISETHHRSVFEGAVHGIYRGTLDGRFLEVNPALVDMLGYSSAEEVLKLSVSQDVFNDPEEGLRLLHKWQLTVEIEEEVQWKRRDQRLITVRLSGRVLCAENHRAAGLEVIAENVTETRALEEQLRQAQKIEAVGQLAGGMAHEFNNYLGIVLGYSELLLEEAGTTEGLRRNVAEIKAATQRAASVTRQLLALSRRQVLEPRVLDVNAVVWETHKLLRRLIPGNIDLVPVLEPNLQPVKVDPAQIQQILINLVVNARDAMPQGGKVVIETANVELDEEYAGRHIEVQPGRYVMLAVSDNGSGIDEHTKARIFEPFFTTKQEGKGTGLGLSTVYGIVRQSGGHITVESALREGTRFRIYLPPTAVTELKVEDETPPMQTEILSGTETVLVVEDEPALRRLISVSLEKRGYTVLVAEDGTEAIRILENNPGEIDLVISDIMMPRLNGLELQKKAILLRPEMRFLFISGYAEDTIGRTAHLPQDAGYLEKPFLPIELARKVRALLNESDTGRGSTGKTA